MTGRYPWIVVVLLVGALVLAACGGAESDADPEPTVAAAVSDPVDTQADASAPQAGAAGDSVGENAADNAGDDTASAADISGKRDAPAPVDGDYAEDTATLVGATGRPQVVEFFTYWCSVCRTIKPTIHALEAEYWGQVDFVYLDRESDANSDVVQRFGIFGQPVLVLLDANGNELQRWFGLVDSGDLRAALDKHLAAS